MVPNGTIPPRAPSSGNLVSSASERCPRRGGNDFVGALDLPPAGARRTRQLVEDVQREAVRRRGRVPVMPAAPPEREQQVADLAAPLLGGSTAAGHGQRHP